MDVLCLVVAGVVRATLPDAAFTLAWTHSVQKTRWEEHYRVEGERLRLVDAIVEGSGAGMEPGPDAVRSAQGWRWSPDRALPAVVLAASGFGGDHVLCTASSGCRGLRDLAGTGAGAVTVVPCAAVGSR